MMNKQPIIQHFDALALHRAEWYSKNRLYHEQIIKLCRLFMNPDSRVLELGCSTGDTLAALNPSYGVGIDISPCMIAEAQKRYPNLYWICADAEALPQDEALSEPFDLIIMEDLAGYLSDIQQFFADIRPLTHSRTRLIISTWNWIWEPVLILGEYLKLKAPEHEMMENWVSASVLSGLLRLTGYDPLQIQPGLLFPYHVPVLSSMINTLSFSPLFGRLTLSSIIVARPLESPAYSLSSVSVIIPVRNEVGNIAAIVERTPDMGAHTELIFVDGNSTDGTVPEIRKQIDLHPERDIRLIPQVPMHDSHVNTPPNLMLKLGKGDATRKGFDAASGEILMILDGDVSVPPEDLRKFYNVIVSDEARFANGTRFIYNQEEGAMRLLNRLGNILFGLLFSWLLGQRVTDTLCGTKVLRKKDYEAIAANRSNFGDFDPFGDFDLLFGAARLGLSIADIPVRYKSRTYGVSKVRVGKHGLLLGRMCIIALWQFKIRPIFRKRRCQ